MTDKPWRVWNGPEVEAESFERRKEAELRFLELHEKYPLGVFFLEDARRAYFKQRILISDYGGGPVIRCSYTDLRNR